MASAMELTAELLEAILDTVLDAIITIDEQGVVRSVNPAFERLFGYDAEQTVGQNVRFLMPEPDRTRHDDYIRRYLQTGEGRVIGRGREVLALHQDGTVFPIHLGISEAVYRGQRLFVGIVRDLTAQRRAESQRDRHFALTSDLVCTIDFFGLLRTVNAAWERMLGLPAEQLQDRPLLTVVHPDDHAATRRWLDRLRSGEGGEPGQGRAVFENRCRARDGSDHWVEWAGVAAANEELIYAAGRDIGWRKRAEEERAAVDRMKSEFVAMVSHELRTPLTSIRGSLGLIEGGVAGTLPARAQQLVEIACNNTDRLIRLINDILDLEKIESGEIGLRRERLVVDELVRAALETVAAAAEQAGVTLRRSLEPGLLLEGDADRLVQVLVNLLGNAIKFSPPGGSVEIAARRVGPERIRISVDDQGPGISPEDRQRLFRRFQQLDSSDRRPRGGTGLGLAISKAIVEQHGGEIGVEPGARGGSQFFFLLSARRPTRELQRAGPVDAQQVLLVEDDRDLAQVLRTQLCDEGYRVAHVATIGEARQFLAARLPDAILLDVTLPDGNGLSLWDDLRDDPRTAQLPVVVLSASTAEEQLVGGPLLVHWLRKPVAQQRILQALRRAMHDADRPVTALIVEDDEATRQVLTAQLKELGLVCLWAADGEEAVRLARSAEPDLIILDVMLPDVDGFEVVEALRRARTRTIPLLVYSVLELQPEERDRLKLGMTRHLTKSRVSDAQFVEAVRDLLAGLLPADRGST